VIHCKPHVLFNDFNLENKTYDEDSDESFEMFYQKYQEQVFYVIMLIYCLIIFTKT